MRGVLAFFRRFVVFSCGALCLASVSCADSEPDIVSATGALVFDYATDESLPASRLAVFVQTESDVRRVSSLLVVHEETGYRWYVTAPDMIKGGDKQWACAPHLLPPENGRIPAGEYALWYTDAAGEEAESAFTVAYAEKLFGTTADGVTAVMTGATEDSLALYDKDDVLIYFGKRKNGWNENADILRDYGTAYYLRHCIAADGNRVVCLLPAEYLIARDEETGAADDDINEAASDD